MRQLLVANMQKNSKRYPVDRMHTILKAQIENSSELGWCIDEMILLTNFEFEFMGVRATVVDAFNEFCLTGSKMFGIKWLFDKGLVGHDDVIWAKDLDAWQNVAFSTPLFKDVGIAKYSTSKYNGGSVFWKGGSGDIADAIVTVLETDVLSKEEPTINKVLKSKQYRDRVTVLNETFNVGCSGFVPRYTRSIKPVRVCHFHPTNKIAWETHALDRNGIDEVPITPRLEKLVRRYYPHLATKLSKKGQAKADMLRQKRLEGEQAA